MSSRASNNTLRRARETAGFAIVAAALMLGGLSMAGCNRHQNEGVQGLLGMNTPGLATGAQAVGFVDMDAIIKSHPLHTQVDAMQSQIDVLRTESVMTPAGMSPEQSAAYAALQRDLDAAQQRFEADLAARRSSYQAQEAAAISQLQQQTLGQQGGSTVLNGLQQQFGQQAKALQTQAFSTLNVYRNQLFKQDADHLRQVQRLLASDVQTKARQRQNELAAAETKYQVSLAQQDQSQRLNLQAKLQNLALSDKDRADYTAQLRQLDNRENGLISAMKSQDNAALAAYQKQLQADASAKYDAERKSTQAATQAKLVARQKELQTAMGPQIQALGGKFQQQLNDVNQKLANDPKYQSQAQNIHNQMQSRYVAEAGTVAATYRDTRKALITKYSAIAHMQFQDNQAISDQVDKLAADRRDLLQKIIAQITTATAHVAQQDGVGVVLQSVRAGGTAIDMTQQVIKAIAQTATAAPTNSPGGP